MYMHIRMWKESIIQIRNKYKNEFHLVKGETDRYWNTMQRHQHYISAHGEDMPEIRDWQWQAPSR